MKGVDDLDFFIGDEAIEKPTYATKVCFYDLYKYFLLKISLFNGCAIWNFSQLQA